MEGQCGGEEWPGLLCSRALLSPTYGLSLQVSPGNQLYDVTGKTPGFPGPLSLGKDVQGRIRVGGGQGMEMES